MAGGLIVRSKWNILPSPAYPVSMPLDHDSKLYLENSHEALTCDFRPYDHFKTARMSPKMSLRTSSFLFADCPYTRISGSENWLERPWSIMQLSFPSAKVDDSNCGLGSQLQGLIERGGAIILKAVWVWQVYSNLGKSHITITQKTLRDKHLACHIPYYLIGTTCFQSLVLIDAKKCTLFESDLVFLAK